MKRFFWFSVLLASSVVFYGQQLPLYSQYLYNKFLINPAHAGSDGYTSFNITAREQWVGITGSPVTFSLSWQTRILKKEYRIKKNFLNRTTYMPKSDGRVGLGCNLYSDKTGLINRTGIQFAYSYNVWINGNTQLSLGMALAGYHFRINADEGSFGDSGEPWLNNNLRRGIFISDVDFGVYILNPRFDFGFSALQLSRASVKTGDYASKDFRTDRHYYLFGSYDFDTGSKSEIEPTFLFKISEQLMPQTDIGLTYIYGQIIWAGIVYRTGSSMISNFRFRFFPSNSKWASLFIGYAFDFSLNKLQRVTYGSHEFTAALKFGDSKRKYRWLDRY